MNFLNKKNDPENSWEPILRKFGLLSRIELNNLVFSSSVLTCGFPSSLYLKNSFSEICIYDGNFDVKMGEFHINYREHNDGQYLQVIGVITKEQFNYLYTTSLSHKNVNIEFNTPMLRVEKMQKFPVTEPIMLQNCTFWIHGEE